MPGKGGGPGGPGATSSINDGRVDEYTRTVESVKEHFDTSVVEAVLICKVPEDIREEVTSRLYLEEAL